MLPIVGPLSGAPIFLSMTADLAPEERGRMAKAVAVNSFLLLIASALIGAYVLDFFGLSIPAVQVAGGLVVCAVAWSLLNSPNSPPILVGNGPSTVTAVEFSQRAFYPLTMPLTVGRFDRGCPHTRSKPGAGPSSIGSDRAGAHAWHLDRRHECLPLLPLRRSHPQEVGTDWNQRGDAPLCIHPAMHRRQNILGWAARAAGRCIPQRYFVKHLHDLTT